MAWYLSEGSTTKVKDYGYSSEYQIKITQHDQDNKNEIAEICQNLFETVWVGENAIYVLEDLLAQKLHKLGKSWEKHVPESIKTLPPKLLELFLDTYMKGDGYEQDMSEYDRGDSVRQQIFTSSKKLAEDLMEIVLKVGKVPKIIPPKEKEYREVEHWNGTYKTGHPTYKVFINQQKYARFYHESGGKVEYHGKVYDVELPKNHILYVRRNDKAIWSGNCRCYASPVESELQQYAQSGTMAGVV